MLGIKERIVTSTSDKSAAPCIVQDGGDVFTTLNSVGGEGVSQLTSEFLSNNTVQYVFSDLDLSHGPLLLVP